MVPRHDRPRRQLAARGRSPAVSWILAYDIGCPRRWRRVHARVAALGYRLQYSLWWLPIRERQLDALLADLATVIDPGVDDIRAYPFPDDAWCRLWGPPPWTDGVIDPLYLRFRPHWCGLEPDPRPR
ncbi:MAG: CRISPR-associated endonuclease Cas2 [Alphaproteobacteria bacterium]|nr:MAG: CRISPR-associated endonuclease Cas2 [Alphaproteobacteria bacterium]